MSLELYQNECRVDQEAFLEGLRRVVRESPYQVESATLIYQAEPIVHPGYTVEEAEYTSEIFGKLLRHWNNPLEGMLKRLERRTGRPTSDLRQKTELFVELENTTHTAEMRYFLGERKKTVEIDIHENNENEEEQERELRNLLEPETVDDE